jgi:hypothetical protein
MIGVWIVNTCCAVDLRASRARGSVAVALALSLAIMSTFMSANGSRRAISFAGKDPMVVVLDGSGVPARDTCSRDAASFRRIVVCLVVFPSTASWRLRLVDSRRSLRAISVGYVISIDLARCGVLHEVSHFHPATTIKHSSEEIEAHGGRPPIVPEALGVGSCVALALNVTTTPKEHTL